ncbi:DUF3987 domain-containing protein [Methylocystis sp. H4A]|uniref:DUF3987 domain-containing protein n=1 Tax=Methylocystis sp. H4A TaxID=2785788 RepID=UPI0018C34619|nr:DUF3987 domain-containing protein [Methylocystis sp. H4A]MBG0800780.1 DUF3987 domain-containing protein [Methylocystis sp. H4A]
MAEQQPHKKDGAPEARRQVSSPEKTASNKYGNEADKSTAVTNANGATHGVAKANGASRPPHCDAKGKPFGEGRASILNRTWRKYYPLGYSPLGIYPPGTAINDKDRSKSPVLYAWQRFCDQAPDPREITATLQIQPRAQIGVACGYDGLIVLDFDSENPRLKKACEEWMQLTFPDAPRRLGNPARAGAYLFRWENEGEIVPSMKFVDDDNKTIFEVLGHGRQVVMPPSMHPTGVPYRMADGEELPPPLDELPILKQRYIDDLVKLVKQNGFAIRQTSSARTEGLPTPEELRVYEKLIPAKKAVARTIDYLKTKAPISVEGKRGHDNACRVWQKCADLGCPPEHITPLMWIHWNGRCQPPWDTYDGLYAETQGLLNSRRSPIGIDNPERIAATYCEEADPAPASDGSAPVHPDGLNAPQPTSQKEKMRLNPVFDPWERYVVPDFPFEILPPDLAHFVETHSIIIGCDPSALAMCVMSALSSALDHRFALKMMRNGDFHASPRLWMLLFGPPSTKKTPMQNAALAPLTAHENRLMSAYRTALAAHEASDGKPKDEPREPISLTSNDVTPESLGEMLSRHERGMMVFRDEVAGWIGGMEKYSAGKGGASDRAFWLKAFDGGPYKVNRISRKAYIPNLSISLLGGIQPKRLAELHGLTSDGLLQRFVPVIMREAKFPEDIDDGGSKIAYTRLVEKCLSAHPATLRMTDEAMKVMTRLRKHLHDVEQSSGGFADGFQGFVGKLAGIAGSFALILHLIKGDPHMRALAEIDVETIEHVDRLVRDFILPHAFEFYRTSETQTNGDRLQRIASWILTNGKDRIVASDLTSGVRMMRGLSLAQVNEWLSPLIAGSWLVPDPDEKLDSTRLNKKWLVNPRIKELFAERTAEEERRKQAIAELMNSDRRARRSGPVEK